MLPLRHALCALLLLALLAMQSGAVLNEARVASMNSNGICTVGVDFQPLIHGDATTSLVVNVAASLNGTVANAASRGFGAWCGCGDRTPVTEPPENLAIRLRMLVSSVNASSRRHARASAPRSR